MRTTLTPTLSRLEARERGLPNPVAAFRITSPALRGRAAKRIDEGPIAEQWEGEGGAVAQELLP
jgi:hypothetical protein